MPYLWLWDNQIIWFFIIIQLLYYILLNRFIFKPLNWKLRAIYVNVVCEPSFEIQNKYLCFHWSVDWFKVWPQIVWSDFWPIGPIIVFQTMDKLTVISTALFLTSDILAIISLLLPDWIVSEVGGDTRFGLLRSCVSIYGRNTYCYSSQLQTEWTMTLLCIILGCICVTTTVVLFIASKWNPSVISYGRWFGFAAMVLFCLAAVIFPMGFTVESIGGQPYQLPSSHQVWHKVTFITNPIWMSSDL